MIGEYNESNGPMGLTKTKRDEYLIEIRKKKNLDMIRQKRMKYFTNDDLSNNPDMLVEDTTQAHMSQKALQDVARIQSLPEEVSFHLSIYDKLGETKTSRS
jgi:Importin beta binding domain.